MAGEVTPEYCRCAVLWTWFRNDWSYVDLTHPHKTEPRHDVAHHERYLVLLYRAGARSASVHSPGLEGIRLIVLMILEPAAVNTDWGWARPQGSALGWYAKRDSIVPDVAARLMRSAVLQ